jgi:hypothetical protein
MIAIITVIKLVLEMSVLHGTEFAVKTLMRCAFIIPLSFVS